MWNLCPFLMIQIYGLYFTRATYNRYIFIYITYVMDTNRK